MRLAAADVDGEDEMGDGVAVRVGEGDLEIPVDLRLAREGGAELLQFVAVEARVREQVAAALAALADWDGPAVVGGDFNTVTRANVLDLARTGKAAGFHRIGGYGPTVEWKAAGLRLRRFVLDHVLHRGLVAASRAATLDTDASDHRSVWATFELPPLPEPELATAV